MLPVSDLAGETPDALPSGRPIATIDLMKEDGLRQVRGQWRTSDVAIVPSDFNGTKRGVYDYSPHAGAKDFDDFNWPVIPKESLEGEAGESKPHEGRMSFEWYRLTVTVPERIGDIETTGSTVVFDTTIDDYSEIWVNGELLRWIGEVGAGTISGFNAPNRLVIGRNVKPGQKIQIAVFAINGPISAAPANTVFMRKGTRLDFYCCMSGPVALDPVPDVNSSIEDPDNTGLAPQVINRDPHLKKLAEGLGPTSSAAWSEKGYLIFNNVDTGVLYRYDPVNARVSIFSPYANASRIGGDTTGATRPKAIAFDPQGALVVAQEGKHNIVRINQDGTESVIADSHQGVPLNGPAALVYRADGILYFTDLYTNHASSSDPTAPEARHSGVYSLSNGQFRLLADDLPTPVALALSPRGRFLYVLDSETKVVMRYCTNVDGSVAKGEVFFDLAALSSYSPATAIAVGQRGDVYIAGPGGIAILSPQAKYLGAIVLQNGPRTIAWGDPASRALFLTAADGLYQLRISIPAAPWPDLTSNAAK
jgi:gluconolactonase